MQSFRNALKFFCLALLSFVFVAACYNSEPTVSPPIPDNGKLVTHALGETVVPLNPQRVVVLTSNALDNSLALGIKPVGSSFSGFAQRDGYGNFPAYLQDKTEGITNVGHADSPSLEKILALKPDLILGSKQTHQAISKQLSQIAPTVLTEYPSEKNLFLHGEALGKIQQAEKLRQELDNRFQEFQQQMGEKLATTEVSVLRFRPYRVRLYMNESFAGYVLDRAGLQRPTAQDQNKSYQAISIEAISAMDGDVIFYFQDNPENSQSTKIMQHPLWSQLEAVKKDRVYEISFDTWFLGNGILATNKAIDDLFQYLIKI
ncbi:Periplasmic binding protein [Hyella patelloides LEGE 07179]|uniref:Periplasmic binding protein n=1 Tax=Hyella patelloides LEGE 07179 TaxID=945734 RepID=A0A563VNF8_9CYAN|nr:iron-siderophore ABC transporter substrate-binding protein [Hyella patelloides]VEP12959.1 Periplasmic binding protein [Hyella patelloides LEGE 07179]